VVKLLVEIIEPTKAAFTTRAAARPAWFRAVRRNSSSPHGGKFGDISIYGQESKLHHLASRQDDLAIRGIEGKIEQGDTFHNRHPDLKADFIPRLIRPST